MLVLSALVVWPCIAQLHNELLRRTPFPRLMGADNGTWAPGVRTRGLLDCEYHVRTGWNVAGPPDSVPHLLSV